MACIVCCCAAACLLRRVHPEMIARCRRLFAFGNSFGKRRPSRRRANGISRTTAASATRSRYGLPAPRHRINAPPRSQKKNQRAVTSQQNNKRARVLPCRVTVPCLLSSGNNGIPTTFLRFASPRPESLLTYTSMMVCVRNTFKCLNTAQVAQRGYGNNVLPQHL